MTDKLREVGWDSGKERISEQRQRVEICGWPSVGGEGGQ